MRLVVLWVLAVLAAADAAAAPFAYAPNDQQQIAVIDLATNSIVTRITTESTTFGIGATNVNRVYVSDFATATLQVINTATNSTVATLNVCAQPGVPVASPDNARVVLPCRRTAVDPGGLMFIDTSTLQAQVANTVPDPLDVVWSPDGSRLYVTTTDRVWGLNASDGSVIFSVPVTLGAFAITVNATNTKLYVSSFGDGGAAAPAISSIDLASGQVTAVAVDGQATWIALNPAGTLLFAAMPNVDRVEIFAADTLSQSATINFPPNSRPQSVAANPDGSHFHVQAAGEGRLYTFDLQNFGPAQTVRYGNSGAALGNWIGAGSLTRAAQAPGYLSGLWFNSSESGWGIQLTKRHVNIVATWFTYDAGGAATWYIAPGCRMATPTVCSGDLYRVQDVKFFGGFDNSLESISIVGTLQLQFQGVNEGGMSYTVNGISRFVPIQRENVAAQGASTPAVNFTDLWWNPAESGWGMTVTHQPGNMFLAWFVYDTNRKPTWFVSTCPTNAAGTSCSGTLLRVTGPPFGAIFDTTQVHATTAGTVSLSFTDPDNGVLTYSVDGAGSGTKNITREIF